MKRAYFTRFSTPDLAALMMVACFGSLLQIQTSSAAPSVVGLWRFNEGSGTTATDSSGLGNNGTLAGENGAMPVWVTGQTGFGGALWFTNDGTDHVYVNIPGAASLMIGQTATNTWTITAWAYEDSNGTGDFVASYGRILVIDDGTAFQFESGASGDAEIYTWARANAAMAIGVGRGSAVAPLLDQWVHWAVVYDGTNLTVYRNANQGPQGGVASAAVNSPVAFPGYARCRPDRLGTGSTGGCHLEWDVGRCGGVCRGADAGPGRDRDVGDFSAFLGGPPGIVSQPQGQTVAQGTTATFSVGADGQAPFQYQWYFNGTNKLSRADNPTATNATLVLTDLLLSQSGSYSAVVSNALGSISSQPATLVVFNTNATLLGLWRFDQGNGTNVLDSSGLGNNGYSAGENGNVPAWRRARQGSAARCASQQRHGSRRTSSSPALVPWGSGRPRQNPLTITAWAYEDSDGTGDFVANYGRVLVIDDGTAFQFESGLQGMAKSTPGRGHQRRMADRVARLPPSPRCWTSGSIGRWFMTDESHGVPQWELGSKWRHRLSARDAPRSADTRVTRMGYLIGSELAQPGDRTWNRAAG